MQPKLKSYNFFRPSPELLSPCLESHHWQYSPPLPKFRELAIMYAPTHLATGSTIFLHDVSTVWVGFAQFTLVTFPPPTLNWHRTWRRCVLDEQRSSQTVPNRREPCTIELHKDDASLLSVASDPNCLDEALASHLDHLHTLRRISRYRMITNQQPTNTSQHSTAINFRKLMRLHLQMSNFFLLRPCPIQLQTLSLLMHVSA